MKKNNEKEAFVRGFVSSFLGKVGMSPAELTLSKKASLLVKLAAPLVDPAIQKALNDAAQAKAVSELQRSRVLTNVGTPFMLGSLSGAAMAKLFRPSDVEVGNLQKQELLTHYDDAIHELKRRIESHR